MTGRIPQNFIDDLLDRTDIVEVIDRRVPLKKSGKNFSARCPFHDEKTPSFSVNQEKQFYYCFGCGAGGNAIGFLMDYERLEFPRAVETLADAAGLEVPKEATALQEEPQQKRTLYSLMEQVADYYRQQLREHPAKQRAVDYLKNRGLSGEIARDFDIGYAPPGWDNLIKALGKTDEEKQLLIDAGMLVDREEDNKLYDRFRDRIMFPIRDSRGRVIAFGGRVLGDDKPKYLNSPETAIFHKGKELYGFYQARKANRQLQRILIVEGYMDVIALSQNNINWAAATLGTATSADHLKRVFRQCPEVIFCFDGDEAGRKAANRALETSLPTMEDGRQIRFLFLPDGEDPDSLVRNIGNDAFQRLADKATPLEQFLFDHLSTDLDVDTMNGRARLSKLAAPMIGQLPEGVFKELMTDNLAQRTGLNRETLTPLLQAPVSAAPASTETAATSAPAKDARDQQFQPPRRQSDSTRNPVLYAIAMLLHQPRVAAHIEFDTRLTELSDPNAPLLYAILELLHKRPDSTSAMLIGHWYGEAWGETLRTLLHMDHYVPEDNIGEELADTLNHLLKNHQRQHLDLQVDQLLSTDYSELSDAHKEQLRIMLSERHSK
jgi:DNA primase